MRNIPLEDRLKDHFNFKDLFYQDMNEERERLIEILEKMRMGEEMLPEETLKWAEDVLEYYQKLTGKTHPQIEQIIHELREN